MSAPIITAACARHAAAIAAITRDAFAAAFGSGDGEVALIEALRADGDVVAELAALDGDEVVGHILFSRASCAPPLAAIAGLAPMCAKIGRQKEGIGSALVRAGLEACRIKGIAAVIVLGDNAYYERFGFSAELATTLACSYAGPHFMALELVPGALKGITSVAYAKAFGDGV